MPATIPESHRDLLERPVLASLATLLPSGQPQVTPVWADEADGLLASTPPTAARSSATWPSARK